MWAQNKFFFLFLIKFSISYLVLIFLYACFLEKNNQKKDEIDFFTENVAKQTHNFLLFFDKNCKVEKQINTPSYSVVYKNKFISRIIEGCNGVNMMILFVSFVLAFSSSFKKTILYILFGCLVLYVFNILRLVLINILIYNFPQYTVFLHDIFFPLMIYGLLGILWYFWVIKIYKQP